MADVDGIGALTLGGFVGEVGELWPDHEALVFDDPLRGGVTVRWTYGDVEHEARRVAKALLAAGLGKGARVGVLMSNRPEAVAAVFGTALAGGVVVPLSTFSPEPELSYLLGHADLSVLLLQTTMGDRDFAADVVSLCPMAAGPGPVRDVRYPFLQLVTALGPAAGRRSIPSWDDFLAPGDDIDDALLDAVAAQVHPSDPAVIIYSSGTTADPKGVLHAHRAVALEWWFQASLFGRDEATVVWCALPMFWTAGMNLAMGATLAGGSCWVMQEGFDAGAALRLMAREEVTEPHVLPHQGRALEEHPDWAATDLSSCTKVFGKSVFTRHPTVQGDPAWNMPIGYGSSETCSFVTGLPCTTRREDYREGSYGHLLPGNELRVIDGETGLVLGPDQEGELAVRGPTLMEHYVGRTRDESFDADGFYRTGDMGSYDGDGHVFFHGRRTDMIKTSGAAVSPAEIEVQLQAYEPVKLACVVDVPDERRDQLVTVCVELKDGATATEDDIQAFLRERLASYKVPRRVLFFPDRGIPMTRSGTKVDKDELRSLVQVQLGGGA